MDDEVQYAIEELKLQMAAMRSELEKTTGLAVGLQVALQATLRCWGDSAAEVETEVDLAIDLVASRMQNSSEAFLANFHSVGQLLTTALHNAAQEQAGV